MKNPFTNHQYSVVGIFYPFLRRKEEIICLLMMCICLVRGVGGNSAELRDEITYSYEVGVPDD